MLSNYNPLSDIFWHKGLWNHHTAWKINIPTHLLSGLPLLLWTSRRICDLICSRAHVFTGSGWFDSLRCHFIALTGLKLNCVWLWLEDDLVSSLYSTLSENMRLLRWPFPTSLRESSNWFFLLLWTEANKNLHLCTDMPQFHMKHEKHS